MPYFNIVERCRRVMSVRKEFLMPNTYKDNQVITENTIRGYEVATTGIINSIKTIIPGTLQYKLRHEISKNLSAEYIMLNAKMANLDVYRKDVYKKSEVQYYLYGSILTSIKFRLVIETTSIREEISTNYKSSLKQILINNTPLISELFYVNKNRRAYFRGSKGVALLLHSLLNPARLLDSLLGLIKISWCRLMEIGSDKRGKSNILRRFLKGIIMVPITLLKLALTFVNVITDIPYRINYVFNFFKNTNFIHFHLPFYVNM